MSADDLADWPREAEGLQVDGADGVVRPSAAGGVVVDQLDCLDVREVVADIVQKSRDDGQLRVP